MDRNIKPLWYIGTEVLVTILQVIKNLDEDLKRKIVKIIMLHNKKEEKYNMQYNNFFDNDLYDTSDWYYSE